MRVGRAPRIWRRRSPPWRCCSLAALVASEWPEALVYTMDGLDGLDGTVYEDTVTKRRVVVEDDGISFSIPEHGVQVLAPVGGNGG